MLFLLITDHFKELNSSIYKDFNDYDSEIIRLSTFLIDNDLVFIEGLKEGKKFIKNLFDSICRLQIF